MQINRADTKLHQGCILELLSLSDECIKFEMSASETLYGCQFTLSAQLINQDYLVMHSPPFHQCGTTVSLNLLCLSLYISLYITNCFPVLTASQKDIYQGLCISSKSTPSTTTNLVDWVALDVLREYCLAISFVWMNGNNSFYFFTEHSAEYDSKSQSLAAKEVFGEPSRS